MGSYAIDLGRLGQLDIAWLWHTLLFIALWTGELFVVQAITLISPQEDSPRFLRWAPRIRLCLDLSFVTAIVLLVPRALGVDVAAVMLAIVSVIVFVVHLALLSHYYYFLRPLSALTMFTNWHEGVSSGGYRFIRHPRRLPLLILGAVLAIKLLRLWDLHWDRSGLSQEVLWGIGGFAAAAYVGLAILASYLDPLSKIRTTRGLGRLGLIRGYFITWLAEFYYLGSQEVLDSALRQRQDVHDDLTPIEAAIPIRDRLVIVQAESFDYNVLGCEVNGEEVTPFLNRLRQQSLFYRIAAARYLGSADADFVMLSGVMPSLHMITYNIPNYPYENTLPQFMARHGYRTSVFHGNTGNFYNRRSAFERMGFDDIHFSEEMMRQEGLSETSWGIDDRAVLRLSAQKLQQAAGRVCHFVITLTTHTPYTYTTAKDRELYANPQSMAQNFLNNMRYMDRLLEEYVGSLGPATVVIYSDHPADPAVAPEFKTCAEGVEEFVPCFIYDTEIDLGALQKTRATRTARDGSLSLLDISSYLRAQVAGRSTANNGTPPRGMTVPGATK